MKKIIVLLILFCSLAFSNSADKAIALYEKGKFAEASSIAASLDDTKAKNLYIKAITEKIGNEAASLYRKALSCNDITSDLSTKIYQRLAGYYEAVGIPGSVSVMLKRANSSISSIKPIPSKSTAIDSSIKDIDTMKIVDSTSKVKVTSNTKKDPKDTIDFALIEEPKPKKKIPESKPVVVVTKSLNNSKEPKVFYTLQTGAFGLESNAVKMKINLEKSFNNISIKAQKSGERTLYKVRIGRFSSQQEALTFAANKLRPKKIKFRIVKE